MPIEFPKQFAIINDPVFKNGSVTSTSSIIRSKKVGAAVAATTNQGSATLFLTGEPSSDSTYDFRIQDSGKTGEGTFGWKLSTEDDTQWKGEASGRLIHTIESVNPTLTSVSSQYLYHKESNLELVFRPSSGLLRIYYRAYRSSGGGTWSTASLDFEDYGMSTGGFSHTGSQISFGVCKLLDGSILLAVQNENDIDLYKSTDGINYSLFNNGISQNPKTDGWKTQINNVQIAASGNYVCLVFSGSVKMGDYTSPDRLISHFSSDGGASWTQQTLDFTVNSYPATWSGFPPAGYLEEIWAIGALDEKGTFILLNSNNSNASCFSGHISRAGSDWELTTGFNWVAQNVRKVTIVKGNKNVYFAVYALANRPGGQLPPSPTIDINNHEIYLGIWDMENNEVGVDNVDWNPLTSFNGGGHFFIQNISFDLNPDNGFTFFGGLRNIYLDSVKGSVYFRMGGWDTNAYRDFNFSNYTNMVTPTTASLANSNAKLGLDKLCAVEFVPAMGLPTGGYFSQGFLGGVGNDSTLWDMNRLNGTVNLNRERLRITDSLIATTNQAEPSLMYKYTDYWGNLNGVSMATAQSVGALTNYSVSPAYKSDALSPKVNWGFVPYVRYGYNDDDQGIVNSHGHGSCLRFIVKVNDKVSRLGYQSNVVAGICTFLGKDWSVKSSGAYVALSTRVLNIQVGIGRDSISIMDGNVFNSPGSRSKSTKGSIEVGTDAFVDDFWEIRVGVYPYRYTRSPFTNYGSKPKIGMMARKIGATTWYTSDIFDDTDFQMEQQTNHTEPILNQVAFFGHKWANVLESGSVSSEWKYFGIHGGNDACTLAYMNKNEEPVQGLNPVDRLPGALLSTRLVNINEGISAVWGGSGAIVSDRYTMAIDYDYAPRNMLIYDTPRIAFEATASSTVYNASAEIKANDERSMFLTHLACTGCRAQMIRFNYSVDGGDTWSSADEIDFRTGLKGQVLEVKNSLITVRWNSDIQAKIRNGMFTSSSKRQWYFYKTFSPTSGGTTWASDNIVYEIVRDYDHGFVTRSDGTSGYETTFEISTPKDTVATGGKVIAEYYPITTGTCFAPSYVAGSSFEIYSDRGWVSSTQNESKGCNAVKLSIYGFRRSDSNYLKIGSLVAGTSITFDPPFDWEWSDKEKANQQITQTDSGVSWVYEQGPSTRNLSMKMQGDIDEHLRARFRNTLNGITKYSKNPMFLVLGEATNPTEASTGSCSDLYNELLFVRFEDSSDFKNQGWKYNSETSQWNTVGSMSFKFVEVV